MISSFSNNLSSIGSKTKGVLALVAVLFLTAPSICIAEENAIKLLNKMIQALPQLTYKGDLVLIQGNKVTTLMVDHSVVNGVQSERVVQLNEGGGEVSKEVKGFSLSSLPRIRPEMEKVYSFDWGRENRVANIRCRVITARPKDRERYLQKYCIDTASGMLLDYRLVSRSHEPVEQLVFTSIEIRQPESTASNYAPPSKLTPINDQDGQPRSEVETLLRQISNSSLEDGWIVGEIPTGFEINQAPHMKEELDNGAIITKHYVLTDGLISVSLFLTPITSNSALQDAVQINSGALNMVTQNKSGYRITAVGEVPKLTLKNIVKNLKKGQ